MKKLLVGSLLVLGLGQTGCAFFHASAVGTGYENDATREMNNLERDYKADRISRREYESRKGQVELGTFTY
jgi:hypothetical protein